MATIPNTISGTSPLGDSFAILSKALLSGPTPLDRDKADAAIQSDIAAAALNRQKTLDLQRGAGYEGDAAAAIRDYFTGGDQQALLTRLAPGLLNQGHLDQIGAASRAFIANRGGSTDNDVVRAMAGAGNALGENEAVSIPGQAAIADRNQQNKVALEYAKPLDVGEGNTAYLGPNDPRAPNGQRIIHGAESRSTTEAGMLKDVYGDGAPLPGMDPSIDLKREYFTQARAPQTPHNMRSASTGQVYISYDGVHDARSNAPLPTDAQEYTSADTRAGMLPDAAKADLVQKRTALRDLEDQITSVDQMLQQPDAANSMSWLGSINSFATSAASQIAAGLRQTGVQIDVTFDPAKYADLFAKYGIQGAKLQSALQSLAFATAQQSQPGKLSDDDVRRSFDQIGAKLGNPQAMREVLGDVRVRARGHQSNYEKTMREVYGDALFAGIGAAPWETAPAAATTPAAVAPAQAPAPAGYDPLGLFGNAGNTSLGGGAGEDVLQAAAAPDQTYRGAIAGGAGMDNELLYMLANPEMLSRGAVGAADAGNFHELENFLGAGVNPIRSVDANALSMMRMADQRRVGGAIRARKPIAAARGF